MKTLINMLVQSVVSDTQQVCVERVLWVDSPGHNGYKIDVFSSVALPVWFNVDELDALISQGEIRIIEIDPYRSQITRPNHLIPEKHQKIRNERWAVIKDLLNYPGIFDSEIRWRAVMELQQQKITTRVSAYDFLRKFWQRGQTKNALLPDYEHCGGRGKTRPPTDKKRGRPRKVTYANPELAGINIDDHKRDVIIRGLRTFYEKQGLSFKAAFRKVLLKNFFLTFEKKDGQLVPVMPPTEQLPTVAQARYWYKQATSDLRKTTIKREGERTYNLTKRPLLGDSTQMAVGPGAIYQVDATVGDLYLVSKYFRNRIIGRPVIYIVKDVFSRLITGFAVLLEGPSWRGATVAVNNVLTNKVEFCREYHIEIAEEDWPAHYAPVSFIADRGEFEGFNADNLTNALGITISNTPPYRADWKGIVEQAFRLLNLRGIKFLPGALRGVVKRGGPDYRLDAELTLEEFIQVLIYYILRFNNSHRLEDYNRDEFMIADHVPLYPIDLWNWGIQNRTGLLREIPRDVAHLNLLVQDQASVTEYGIYFKKLYYDCPLARTEQWYIRARANARWKIPVAYDPRSADVLYLSLDNGRRVEACHLLEKSKAFSEYTHYDIEDQFYVEHKEAFHAKTHELQAEGEFDAKIQAIIEPAQEATKLANQGLSKRARTKDIRANRQREREELHRAKKRRDQAHLVDPLGSPSLSNQTSASTEADFVPQQDYTEDILRWQKGETQDE